MTASSSSAEPIPGTCTRMRSAALALDRRLARAGLVDAAADDLEALLHGAPVDRGLLGRGQGHDQRVALGTHVELAARAAGQRKDRLRGRLHRRERRVHPVGVADADVQLVRRAVQPPDGPDLVAKVAELVAQHRPEPLHPLGVDVGGLDLDQNVRAAAQVEAEVDQPGGQPARPAGGVGRKLGRRRRAGRQRRPRVVGALDAAVEDVRQRDEDAGHADPEDQDLLPERKVLHLGSRSPRRGPAAARLRPRRARSCSRPG